MHALHDTLDAIYTLGEQIITALDASDFEAVVEQVAAREALVGELPEKHVEVDALRMARLAHQNRLLAEALQTAHTRLSEALHRSDQYQHAAASYADAAPSPSRLHAHG